jgi:hypothetical protein
MEMMIVARTATTVPTLFHETNMDTYESPIKDSKEDTSDTSSQGSLHRIYSGEVAGESDQGSGDESYVSFQYDQGSDDILNQLKRSTPGSGGKSASTPTEALAIEAPKRFGKRNFYYLHRIQTCRIE